MPHVRCSDRLFSTDAWRRNRLFTKQWAYPKLWPGTYPAPGSEGTPRHYRHHIITVSIGIISLLATTYNCASLNTHCEQFQGRPTGFIFLCNWSESDLTVDDDFRFEWIARRVREILPSFLPSRYPAPLSTSSYLLLSRSVLVRCSILHPVSHSVKEEVSCRVEWLDL